MVSAAKAELQLSKDKFALTMSIGCLHVKFGLYVTMFSDKLSCGALGNRRSRGLFVEPDATH